MTDLKNKSRRELIEIIHRQETANVNLEGKAVRLPTEREIEEWSMGKWEDKNALTSGYWDSQFNEARIAGAKFVIDFLKAQQ